MRKRRKKGAVKKRAGGKLEWVMRKNNVVRKKRVVIGKQGSLKTKKYFFLYFKNSLTLKK